MKKLIPWALAVCLAAAAIWAAQVALVARSEMGVLEAQQKLVDLELQSARNQIEAERILNQRELTDLRQELAEAKKRLGDLDRPR